MNADKARVALVAFCIVTVSGCSALAPVNIDTRKYMLSRQPAELPGAQRHPMSLLILRPESNRAFDTTRMAYTTQAYQIAYFSQNEWAETPAQMMLPLMVAAISNTHYFEQVLAPPDFGHHSFALRSEILDLEQDFTANPPTLRFTMRFLLSREADNAIVASKEVSAHEAMREKTPYAGVVAANEATAKILRELAAFVVGNAR